MKKTQKKIKNHFFPLPPPPSPGYPQDPDPDPQKNADPKPCIFIHGVKLCLGTDYSICQSILQLCLEHFRDRNDGLYPAFFFFLLITATSTTYTLSVGPL